MSEVERYWIDPSRLVQEGWHQDDTCVVKDWAYDRVVAERDAALANVESAEASAQTLHEVISRLKAERDALQALLSQRDEQIDALTASGLSIRDEWRKDQQRLTAADERADVLTTALTRIHGRAEAFIDDGMHMPTPSIEVIRDIAARAVPITSDAAEPR